MNSRRPPPFAEPLTAGNDRARFACTTAADASGAARIRIWFSSWLQKHFALGEERIGDLVLAVYEALANAAEYGYLDMPGHGTIALTASYDEDVDTLKVRVTDRGRWRPTTTTTVPSPHARRGRGMTLMQALTDETRIDTSERGTHVHLRWTPLSPCT
jgi:serine/threonine-protein kinase RsbW